MAPGTHDPSRKHEAEGATRVLETTAMTTTDSALRSRATSPQRRTRFGLLALATTALLGVTACGGNSSGIDGTDLVGEWVSVDGSSVGARAGSPSGSDHATQGGSFVHPNAPTIEWSLEITEAGPRGFIGEWCSPKLCESLAGVVRKDGTAIMADEDSYFTLTRDGDQLELCVASASVDYQVAVCMTLRRA